MATANMLGWPVARPPGGQQVGQLVIGAALGLYFTAPVVAQLALLAPFIAAAALFAFVLGGVGALLLRRLTCCDLRTAFFASLPGGAAEMSVLADRAGARGDWVAATQALRLVLVVLIVPPVITWGAAHTLAPLTSTPVDVQISGLARLLLLATAAGALLAMFRTPNSWIIGPLVALTLATATGFKFSQLPPTLLNAAQLLIGCTLGSRFGADFLRTGPRLIASAAVTVSAGILLSGAFAFALASLSGTDIATAVLATAPGGVAEMSVTAKLLGLGVPVVVAFHVSRMALLVLTAAPIFRIVARVRAARGHP